MQGPHRRAPIILAAMIGLGGALAPALASESITYTYDALGRLVVAKSEGTVNDDQTHSLCFDPAGNRTKYRSDDTGIVPSCAPTPSAMPSPTAPPTPGMNTLPTAVADTKQVGPNQTRAVDVIANDTDADGDLPLALIAASVSSGSCTVALFSGTEVSVTRGMSGGPGHGAPVCTISYTVIDGRGGSAIGQLQITT
jgi:hypothetical protein